MIVNKNIKSFAILLLYIYLLLDNAVSISIINSSILHLSQKQQPHHRYDSKHSKILTKISRGGEATNNDNASSINTNDLNNPQYSSRSSTSHYATQFPDTTSASTSSSASENNTPQFESFEEWRNFQQSTKSYYSTHPKTQEQMDSPTDENGRMKLIATISNASLGIFFFVLIWRTVHHFELADATFRTTNMRRFIVVVPIVLVFIFNMIGCVMSFTSSNVDHASKKRLKAILNINKLVEIILCLYNTMRLVIYPSKYVAREVYVGRIFTNFIFLIQCQLFTKVAWDAARVKGMSAQPLQEEQYYQSAPDTSYQNLQQQPQYGSQQQSPSGQHQNYQSQY